LTFYGFDFQLIKAFTLFEILELSAQVVTLLCQVLKQIEFFKLVEESIIVDIVLAEYGFDLFSCIA
jgi:hypothetical protein